MRTTPTIDAVAAGTVARTRRLALAGAAAWAFAASLGLTGTELQTNVNGKKELLALAEAVQRGLEAEIRKELFGAEGSDGQPLRYGGAIAPIAEEGPFHVEGGTVRPLK